MLQASLERSRNVTTPSSKIEPPEKPSRRSERRRAGILLHPTSLPGPYGIGDLGPAAEAFLRWARDSGQTVWQVLPLGPTGGGDSPYTAQSSFAGNPLLVSPELLVEEGFLPEAELAALPRDESERVDFRRVSTWKDALLRASFHHVRTSPPRGLQRKVERFFTHPDRRRWLPDWTLYAALRDREGRRGNWVWTAWPEELRLRRPEALARARRELADEVAYHGYVQFLFYRQWERLRGVARELGVEILGDLPIYPSLDSADVWARQDLFELGEDGRPTAVSGVPPDAFSEEGQLWGTPVYRWERHREEGYAWWAARLGAKLALVDRLRLDHFRGFEAFWRVPVEASAREGSTEEREPLTARSGAWTPGPGRELFDAVAEQLGLATRNLPLLAEDLGVITPEVEALLAELDLPGMKVLQFAFDEMDSPYLPHHHTPRAAVYTGTHDNDTCRGWFETLAPEAQARALDYLGLATGFGIERAMIRAAYASVAELAVVPLQDVLALGPEARMNVPGRPEGNWGWRARPHDIRHGTSAWLRRLAEITGRFGVLSAT